MKKDLCFILDDKVEIYHSDYYQLLSINVYHEIGLHCQVLDLITNDILEINCNEFRMCNYKVCSLAYTFKEIKNISYEK